MKIKEDGEIRSKQETLEKKMSELRSIYYGTLSALNKIIDIKDPYNAKHQQRVSDLARALATVMGLPAGGLRISPRSEKRPD
jgi:HD-GYP domain-containing protein (c-di-GMP phosphodiesterase class II)